MKNNFVPINLFSILIKKNRKEIIGFDKFMFNIQNILFLPYWKTIKRLFFQINMFLQ